MRSRSLRERGGGGGGGGAHLETSGKSIFD